jgi:hypothetical protein
VTTTPVNGFDHQAAVDDADGHRHFAANVRQILREDYRLRGDEADVAFGRYLRRQTRWVTPDEAAYDAYRWWTPTVEPTLVLAREAEQRAHARMATAADLDPADRGAPESAPVGDNADRTMADAVEADLAAAESALSLIRGQGRRDGFTGEHVELAGHLKQVLDESSVWDSIVPDDTITVDQTGPADLEAALRPDTVRARDDWDNTIVIDAAFAGTTVTVLRTPGGLNPASYVFMCDSPGGRGEQRAIDVTTIGMIASGDRTPNPTREGEYQSLGKQVRNHLVGLADAVAESREAWREQQARRLNKATPEPDNTIGTGRPNTRTTLGSAR